MEEEKCKFLNCKKKGSMMVGVPYLITLENGELNHKIIEKKIPLNFCEYHWVIAASDHFGVIEKDNELILKGPFELVELIETIMAAREFTKLQQPINKTQDI